MWTVVVIDLRNNGGGSLTEAVSLTGLFINRGPVVQVKESQGEIEVQSDNDPAIAYDGPLAVMVNRFSASASGNIRGSDPGLQTRLDRRRADLW